jgi:hypothetical protein
MAYVTERPPFTHQNTWIVIDRVEKRTAHVNPPAKKIASWFEKIAKPALRKMIAITLSRHTFLQDRATCNRDEEAATEVWR